MRKYGYCLLIFIIIVISFISCSSKVDEIVIEQSKITVKIEEKKLEDISDEEILILISEVENSEINNNEEDTLHSNESYEAIVIEVINKQIEEDFLIATVQLKDENKYIEKKYYIVIEEGKVAIDTVRMEEDKNKYIEFEEVIKEEIYSVFNNIKGNYSIVFKDINESEVLSINNKKMSSASIIKIYIMIEAYNQISQGKIDKDEVVTITESMIVGGAGIIQHDGIGSKYKIDDLIKLMMIESDNIATNILINKLGMSNINEMIKSLGCVDTELNRSMMDFDAINKGIDNYTSVNDLALVLSKLYNGECVSSDYDTEMLSIMKEDKLETKIANQLPAGTIVANKSGELNGIENDVAIVYTDKGAYILCVLTEEGTSEEQIRVIRDISNNIYREYIMYKLEQ